VEPGGKFGPFFKREAFNGGLDLVYAHRRKDMQVCPSPQRTTQVAQADFRHRAPPGKKRGQSSPGAGSFDGILRIDQALGQGTTPDRSSFRSASS
jgi:hypothetical protein